MTAATIGILSDAVIAVSIKINYMLKNAMQSKHGIGEQMMDDVIYRQDAIDNMAMVIWDYPNEIYPLLNDMDMALQLAKDGLMGVPSAQQWIPCSEKMPPKGEMVWVTIRGHDCIVAQEGETLLEALCRIRKIKRVSIGFLDEDGWCGQDYYPMMVTPVAWMPMNTPEPYKGENE